MISRISMIKLFKYKIYNNYYLKIQKKISFNKKVKVNIFKMKIHKYYNFILKLRKIIIKIDSKNNKKIDLKLLISVFKTNQNIT